MEKTVKSILQSSPMLLLLTLNSAVESAPRITMVFQGTWDSAQGSNKGYQKGDVVSYNSVLYQSLVSKNKITPSAAASTHWRKVLEAGTGNGGSVATPDCEHPGVAANLVGCQFLTGIQLYNKDLRGSQLINATLAGDVGWVNLDGANLVGAKFGISDQGEPPSGGLALTLRGGDPGGYATTKLRGANLAGSETNFPLQAPSVDFRNANLTDINWNGANLEGAFMAHSNLLNANLMDCIASTVDLSYADLRSAILWNAKLDSADFYEANLSRSQLYGSDLSGAKFVNANLTDAIINASYVETPTKLTGADFSGANLTGADLSGAIDGDTVIYTAATKFDGATCPDGTKVSGTTVTNCQGHGFGAPQ